jgi:hypothetical protein
MTDSLKPPAKCAAVEAPQRKRLDPEREQDRKDFLAFRNSLGWSQQRTGYELGADRCTVQGWEHPDPEKNRRIPSVAFNKMRRFARDAGFDSRGKLRVAG